MSDIKFWKPGCQLFKLLGEIYKHRLPHQPATAAQFFLESRQLYQELDLTEKAIEIERDL